MWENALRFLSLQDPNVRYVLFGSILLAGTTGVLGTFAYLRKRSLVGDAVAHAALPGVCLAFLLFQSKEPYILLIGALVAGGLATFCIDAIRRWTFLKEDAAIALVLTVFFGAGIVLLTHIQGSGNASQAGLDKFLFGQAASLMSRDVWILGGLSIVLCAAVYYAFKEFKLVSFDPDFARAIGMPCGLLESFLTALTVAAIAVGLQMVGVVMMAALLITPAAAARQWTENLPKMAILAGGIGAASGGIGAFTSALAPRMPTGPWMVVALTGFFVASLLFAPRRGVLARAWRLFSTRAQVAEENLITTLYRLDEDLGNGTNFWKPSAIVERRSIAMFQLVRILKRLRGYGYVERADSGWRLTPQGSQYAERIVRRHRLWELYLTEELQLPPDKVHRDAEEIEHWISQAQEEELENLLAQPRLDPHARRIPRRRKEHPGSA